MHCYLQCLRWYTSGGWTCFYLYFLLTLPIFRQCSDGSDEAVELECHKSRLNSAKPETGNSESVTKPSVVGSVSKAASGQVVNTYTGNSAFSVSNSKATDLTSNDPSKLLASYQPSNYLSYNYPRSPNDKMVDDNFLYSNRAPLAADYSAPNAGGFGLSSWSNQYAALQPNDIYKAEKLSTYGAEPEAYGSGGPLKESLSYWPSFNYQNADLSSLQHSPPSSSLLHQQQSDIQPYSGPISALSSGSRLNESPSYQSSLVSHSNQANSALFSNRFFAGNSISSKSDSTSKDGSTFKETPSKATSNTDVGQSDKPLSGSGGGAVKSSDYSHISSSRKAVEVAPVNVVAISHLRDSSPQSGRETNSAVIALTLGLFVTSILIVIVGCRMKAFKKRIARRGGRSLAHDADYLINGMYL